MKAIESINNKLKQRRDLQRATVARDIREVVVLLGEEQLGKKVDLDLDYFANIVEAEGLSDADLRANVDNYKKRVSQAELAEQRPALQAAAAEAGQAYIEADIAEGRRRKEAHTHLRELEHAEQLAIGETAKALPT